MTRPKILIVDDKSENLFALSATLKSLDAEVIMAESGDEALKNTLNHSFALAILDVQMPEMDGYELAEFIRSEETTKHLPIIFLSAVYSDDHHIFRGYSAGAVDFVVKPYEPRVLINKVQFFLDLDRQKNELQDYKDHLEELVNERTEELKGAMIDLEEEIAERKRTEKELKIAKEKAEESDRLKSVFLANISHEIRTPMNGILGFASFLKEPDLSGEEQQEFISIIESSGERMLNIINDLIDISKIESGQMSVSSMDVSVNKLTETLYIFFKPEAEKKGLQIFLKNALPLSEDVVKTDYEKLYAILTNLIKNAIKYTDEGRVEFGYEKKNGVVEFYVKDTGIGIDDNRHEDIFKRFIQVQQGPNRFYEGAGLGLAITKAYVELLAGKIWVKSEEGKGSRFYFTIPHEIGLNVKPESAEKIASLEVNELRVADLKILVAEDDPVARLLLKTILNGNVKTILYANNGVEAVDMIRKNEDVDLILMDIKMPELDGYEATKQIRKINKEVVIIAQTAFATTSDKEKILRIGFNGYISKPIKKDELFREIKKVSRSS